MIIDPDLTTDRSLLAHHTFSCALATRGGVCDCLPGPDDPGLHEDEASTAAPAGDDSPPQAS
jgi:hypothetical protein